MKVLLLSRYDRLGASSRLRTMQYLPALADAGIDVEVAPLFDSGYLECLYSGKSTVAMQTGAMLKRIKRLWASYRADLLWVEKEALPWVPWTVERFLLQRRVPIVSDHDDAIFHRYDMHGSGLVRRLLGQKIDKVMAASSLVVAGNSYLAERAVRAGARDVEIVPTVVDTQAYQVRSESDVSGELRIGWIGTPGTWGQYMASMQPMLMDLAIAGNAKLRAIGAGRAPEPHPSLEVVEWSEESEVSQIQTLDVGIMPLDDTPWSRGKCGYKLIQYMACGLPVVASPVGVNSEIVEHGVNGFLASTENEWREALAVLLGDVELRRRMGEAGRKKVEREYSLQVYGPKVAAFLRSVALDGR